MSEIIEQNKQLGYVTLDSIVRSALADIGEGMSRYEQFKHYAIEGHREFHFDLSQEIKTTQLSLTAWKAIELPPDYVDWVIIGVVINNQIAAFTRDEKISLYHDDSDPLDGFPDARTGDNSYPSYDLSSERLYLAPPTSKYGEDPGQLYGLTVKSNGVGYFKENRQRREIQFNTNIDGSTKVYLEYISDGYNPCESTVVNLYAAKLIKLYIHWMRTKFAKSSTLWQIQLAEKDYWNQFYKVQNRIQKVTIDDVLECARNGYKLIDSI